MGLFVSSFFNTDCPFWHHILGAILRDAVYLCIVVRGPHKVLRHFVYGSPEAFWNTSQYTLDAPFHRDQPILLQPVPEDPPGLEATVASIGVSAAWLRL